VFGPPSPNSRTAKFSRRHAEGLRIIFGFAICTFGVAGTFNAFRSSHRDDARYLFFAAMTLGAITSLGLLYSLVKTWVKPSRAWLMAFLASCWPLLLAWGIPSRNGGPPIISPTNMMVDRIPGYVVTILSGLLLMWFPKSWVAKRRQG
jgi:hypothetical protein